MIDFHTHLDLFGDPQALAEEVQRRQVGVLSVTTTPSAWPGTADLAKGRPAVRTALGLHPQLATERKGELALFDRYLPETQYVGEVGLDGSPELRPIWADQVGVFDHILRSCEEAGNKVLTIHSRRATSPVLDALDRFEGIQRPILHWFSGSDRELKRAIDRGCWFSVGPAMLAGAKGRSLARAMPRDRIVLETDGPFAQWNHLALQPWQITVARDALAKIWGMDESAASAAIGANESRLLALAGATSSVPAD